MNDIIIRPARPEDADAFLAIYAPYVEHTAITFECEVPSPEEFSGRVRRTLERYPYLAAERDGVVLGYAYAGPFNPRAAYDWSAEVSIYVARGQRRGGIGRRLYEALEACLRAQGILNLCACIAYPEEDDEYLTKDSVLFHTRLGFRMVGQFHDCGCKFGRWYHMVWMEKLVGPHGPDQPPVKPFPQVRQTVFGG